MSKVYPNGVAGILAFEDDAADEAAREKLRAEGRNLRTLGLAGPSEINLSLFGRIDRQMGRQISEALAGAPYAEAIDIAMCSEGGEVFVAYDAFVQIRRHPAIHKTARLVGLCQSAAIIIAMAADSRIAVGRTQILLHPTEQDPSNGSRWTAAMHAKTADQLRWIDSELVGLIAHRSGASWTDINREFQGEDASSLDWCLEHGLIHTVTYQSESVAA